MVNIIPVCLEDKSMLFVLFLFHLRKKKKPGLYLQKAEKFWH